MKRQGNCPRPLVEERLPRTTKTLPSSSEGAGGRPVLMAGSPEMWPASALVSPVTLGKSLAVSGARVLAQESEGL